MYESQSLNAYDVKNEATKQFEEARKLEALIPLNITIGPFLVNVEPLRSRLMKKRFDMAKAMLDLLARQLRKQSDTVSCSRFPTTMSLWPIDFGYMSQSGKS